MSIKSYVYCISNILSSTANATYFFLSFLKNDINREIIIIYFHLNAMTSFCIIKIDFHVRMRENLSKGTKVPFCVLHVQM